MKWTGRILPASLIIATGCVCLAYGLGKFWPAVPVLLVAGGAWWWGVSNKKEGIAPLSQIILLSAIILGLYLFPFSGLMLVSLAATIAAWDLDHFSHRIRTVQRVEEVNSLEKIHLVRLGTVLGAGTLLGAAALLVRVQFSFGVAFALGVVAIFGLSRAIIFLKRSSD